MDPENVKTVAASIADHLAWVDPSSAAVFQANLDKFTHTLDSRMAEWTRQLGPYRGAKIVTYHRDFVYLANRFNLQVLETLESKPGIAPSPAHLATVISAMKTNHARVIIVQPYQNRRTAETVARQTEGMVLDISQQPGAIPDTDTYFSMMDYLVKTIATALETTK